MSGSRIKIAGRFKSCVHMGCFDLNTFVELNQRSRKVNFCFALIALLPKPDHLGFSCSGNVPSALRITH